MRTFFVALFFIALSLILYANTLDGDLIWDDEFLIEKNGYLEGWHTLPRIFQSSLHAFSPIQSNYYRPLQTVTYLVDRRLWGDALWGYHLTNIFLHGLVGFSGYLLAVALGLGAASSFWIALFFTVHPLHTEAVSYLSGRADPLSALFILLSLLLFHRFLRGGSFGAYLSSLGFFGLALLSKEIAITLPFLLFLLLWYERKREIKLESLFPFFLLLSLYAALRLTLLDFSEGTFFQKSEGPPLLGCGKVTLQSLLLFLKLVLLPFPLHMERRLPYEGPFWTGTFWWGCIVAIFFLAPSVVSKERRRTLLGWGWFFIFFLPSSSLFSRTNRIAEHFLYLALLGLWMALIPFGVRRFVSFKGNRLKQSALWVGTIIFVFYFSILTYRQNEIWKDPLKFYRNILTYAPESWLALNNLGTLLLEKGDTEEAIAAFQKGLYLQPMSSRLHNNLASAYRLTGKWQKAVSEYQFALRLNPELVESRYFLAKTYEAMGEKNLADEQYRTLEERGIHVEMRK